MEPMFKSQLAASGYKKLPQRRGIESLFWLQCSGFALAARVARGWWTATTSPGSQENVDSL